MTPLDEHPHRLRDRYAIAIALVYPTLLTIVYFILLAGQSAVLQQAAFAVGKLIQFAFPVFWIARVQGTRIGCRRPRSNELAGGFGLGLALLAGALVLYHFIFKPAGLFGGAAGEAIRQKVAGSGVGTIPRFAALGIFYALFHSLLEEYYWRWFVFGQLRRWTTLPVAIGVSSLGFMAHHVCIVSTFFGWLSPMSILLSLAVGGGGILWAWIYDRTNSLWSPWISHALVDAAIFLIGYDLIAVTTPP